MTQQSLPKTALCVIAVAAATMLAACQREESQTVGQKVDGAIASAERQTEAAKNKTEAAIDKAGDKISEAGGAVASKVEDAAITASVNAELARDDKLSALRIDVDTTGGRVVLSGTAPDAASRERATQLASAVKGVTSVDNRLEVRGG